MNKKLIVSIIIVIIIILFAVFFSKTAISDVKDQTSLYMAKGSNLLISNISQKIGQELKSGGAALENGVNQTKEKISDVENYFSGIANAVAGKNVTTCQPEPNQNLKQ